MEACTQQIDVCCALIIKDDRILITQRSEKMKLPLKWEFPGGKLENNEKAETAIIREIKEELLMNIEVLKPLKPTEHDYGDFKIKLIPFICEAIEGEPRLIEHKQFNWEHRCQYGRECIIGCESLSKFMLSLRYKTTRH